MAVGVPADRHGKLPHRGFWWIGLALLAGYVGWMIAPYVRSVITRDAAVTSWIHVATATIRGTVAELPVNVGRRVKPDGRIAVIRNAIADRTALSEAEAKVALEEANVHELDLQLDQLAKLQSERQELVERHVKVLADDLDVTVTGARKELALIGERLALVRSMTDRKIALGRTGTASQAAIDEAKVEVMELALLQVEPEGILARAELRLRAIAEGIPLLENGNDPDWAMRSVAALKLELTRATSDLAGAQAKLLEARAVAKAAGEAYEKASVGIVSVPPDALVWSIIAGAGSTVDVGAPVAKWVDCSIMLVDVPVSDVEAALVRPSMPADVMLEGENRVRRAEVLLARGAAATIGDVDLAAIAKGRRPGIG
ncbi:MAG TPA: HlyD family efflux transporter periplasmic adaptor subunit [Geminicoccus sp.]|uniref:HlyD family efflux transporter periplasmic adaptor subunit n=1 Tax=Geminicoccus sp. TaxID=2024832 RepID=UPI002E2F1448|nr:HlyD family efflux transporter periplasmic adaptor subunit [Geminicoccus sp.]HEX2524882.1 HlyD family efflux transporter periplasmic adaptor subunit [Geminicoccus sp.]